MSGIGGGIDTFARAPGEPFVTETFALGANARLADVAATAAVVDIAGDIDTGAVADLTLLAATRNFTAIAPGTEAFARLADSSARAAVVRIVPNVDAFVVAAKRARIASIATRAAMRIRAEEAIAMRFMC